MRQSTLVLFALLLVTVIVLVAVIRHRQCSSCTLSKPLGDLHFDTYVINMPGDTARMRGFMREYTTCDLSRTHGMIRHDATVGKKLNLAEYVSPKALREILRAERTTYRQKHYELTRGGVGCWVSHAALWRKILESDKEYALIFEDDCIMSRNLEASMKDIRVPEDWDIVLLGHICNDCTEMECAPTLRVTRFFGLHCYMVSRRGLLKILANPKMLRIEKQIDSVLSDMARDEELVIYALEEPLARQNNSDYKTTIQMQLKRVNGVDEWE